MSATAGVTSAKAKSYLVASRRQTSNAGKPLLLFRYSAYLKMVLIMGLGCSDSRQASPPCRVPEMKSKMLILVSLLDDRSERATDSSGNFHCQISPSLPRHSVWHLTNLLSPSSTRCRRGERRGKLEKLLLRP